MRNDNNTFSVGGEVDYVPILQKKLELVTVTAKRKNKLMTFRKRFNDNSQLCSFECGESKGFVSLDLLNRIMLADLPRKKKKVIKKKLKI